MQALATVLRVIVAFIAAQVVCALFAVPLLWLSNALGSFSIYVLPVLIVALLFLCIHIAIRVYRMMLPSHSRLDVERISR